MPQEFDRHVIFQLGDMVFEYDEEKNKTNLKKHGLPLSVGARVFFDDYRVELDLTIIEWNWMTLHIAILSNVMMSLEVHQQV